MRRTAAWPVVLALLGGVLLFQLHELWSVVDDAYIGFRYLDHWLAGEGLVFNSGERVEGYTALLWAVRRTASELAGEREAGHTALLLAMGSAGLARWTSSGMETVLFAALLALANQRLAAKRRHSPASSALFRLAVLTRPRAYCTRGWRSRPPSGRFAAPPPGGASWYHSWSSCCSRAAHTLFRLTYYGAPLPNTAYAKLGGVAASLVPGGLAYLGEFLLSGGALLLLAALLAIPAWSRLGWVGAALAVQAGAQAVYVVWIGGDYFSHHRFLGQREQAIALWQRYLAIAPDSPWKERARRELRALGVSFRRVVHAALRAR